ncbi:MAG: hypothetical protein WB402_13170, partial [Sulfuricaulis sp.]
SDRSWILEGAAVRVSMVGFDDSHELIRVLDGNRVEEIYSDLTASVDITSAYQLIENLGISFMGPSAKGPFDIEEEVAKRLLEASPINADRSNVDVVRRVVSGVDIVQRSRGKWSIDFGLMSLVLQPQIRW